VINTFFPWCNLHIIFISFHFISTAQYKKRTSTAELSVTVMYVHYSARNDVNCWLQDKCSCSIFYSNWILEITSCGLVQLTTYAEITRIQFSKIIWNSFSETALYISSKYVVMDTSFVPKTLIPY